MLDPFADDVQPPFKCSSVSGVRLQADLIGRSVRLQTDRITPDADEQLLEYRLDADRARTDRTVIGRYVAPANELLALFFDDARDDVLNGLAVVSRLRQENQTNTIFTGRWKRCWRDFAQEGVRHLNEDARAISRIYFATARATMLQVLQNLKRLT